MIAYLSLSLNFFAKQTIVSDFLSSTVHNFKHRNQFKVLSRYYRLCVNELILLHHFLLFSSFFSFYGITLDDLFFSYSYYLFIMVWTLFLIIGITLTVFGLIFLEPILIFFGASADVLPYAYDYMKIILYGSIFLAIGTGMNNFIRAEGNPKVAMNTMIVGTVTNIILDYIFIFIFNWGIKGAAFATIISYMITSYLVIRYFIRGNSRLKIRRENLMLRKLIVKSVLIIGFPTFVLQVTGSIQQLILNKSLVHYGGDKALAIIGIIMSILALILAELYILAGGGEFLGIAALIKVLGLIIVCTLCNSSLVLFMVSFFKSNNAFATASTIIGTLIGFLTGVYLPIGQLPESVQWIIKCFPPTHGAVLFRQAMMDAPLATSFNGAPAQAVSEFDNMMGVTMNFGYTAVKPLTSLIVLLATAAVFYTLSLINISRKQK